MSQNSGIPYSLDENFNKVELKGKLSRAGRSR